MRRLSGGLFLVTLSTVMFEVLLTRIFSLTMWYHFAFMAISMAMLGMTVGALFVFLRPLAWPEVTLLAGMGRSALLFAVSMVVVILLHIVFLYPTRPSPPYRSPLRSLRARAMALGVNGAVSVLASVLAVVIAMGAGISSAFWAGVASYLVAAGAFALAARQLSHNVD